MNEGITVQQLEAEKKRLEAQLKLISDLLSLRKGEGIRSSSHLISPDSTSSTVRGRIIDAVVELIKQQGRQVTNKEILAHVEEKQLSLGNIKNKVTGIGAMLGQESKKKSARIRQVTRGTWDLK